MQRMCSMCRKVKDERDFYYREKSHRYNACCKSCESKKLKHYAIYKGETFLFEGTARECAEHFNVAERTVYFWASPTQHKRANENWKIAIAINDEEE